jgi:DNA repair protein RecO (recombination protein O)
MPAYKANAIVLRRIPLGETDKVLTLFTREYGKLSAIAKGARRTTSRLAGATEPLMFLRGLLAEGMNLDILTQAEIRESFSTIRSNFGLFLRATYACELLDKVTAERDAAPEAFDLLLSTLYILQRARDPDVPLHSYELRLTGQIGYEPQLDSCVRCERGIVPDGLPAGGFSPSRGGAVCDECAFQLREELLPMSADTLSWLRYLASEDDAFALADAMPPDNVREEMNRLLRSHLRYRLERDVRSTAFLDAFRVGAMDRLEPLVEAAAASPAARVP